VSSGFGEMEKPGLRPGLVNPQHGIAISAPFVHIQVGQTNVNDIIDDHHLFVF
jgi:hypothetical protein